MSTNPFVPPAAGGLPLAALDSATEGADALDAWAADPHGRNFLAHALVQLARDGWLRPEAGEGFEPVRERDDVPEPQDPAVLPAVPVPPTTGAGVWVDGDPLMEAIAAAAWDGCRTEGTSLVVDDPRNIAAAVAGVARGAVLRQAVEQLSQVPFASVLTELRRLADETQQPEPCRNCRGSGLDPRYNGEFACPDCPHGAEARQQPDTETRCGAWGGCPLPLGHNRGRADIPENHHGLSEDMLADPQWETRDPEAEAIERDIQREA